MYKRPHHQQIAALLAKLDGKLFEQCQCYFAGGTAISLQLGEFRRSDDIDFVCASTDGYRRLREAVFDHGLPGLAKSGLPVLREPRSDQYGIRAVLGSADAVIKFEIVREARIELSAGTDAISGVPLLCRDDLYAEKLLANTDRGLDRSTLHRDYFDLSMMCSRWGPVPDSAWNKARQAYGSAIDQSLTKVSEILGDAKHRDQCLAALDVLPEIREELVARLESGSVR
jgi:hypothetical protein